MSLVSDIIDGIRFEVTDDDGSDSRWSDAQILRAVKKSLNRADNAIVKHGLEFGKSSDTLTVLNGANTVALPSDFKRDIAVFSGTDRIEKVDTDYFETHDTGDYYRINGINLELLVAVSEDTDLTFWYFPLTDYSAYTTTTTMPWSGKLDEVIINYAALVLKNIDEFSMESDLALLKEIEVMILDVYKPLTATLQQRDGWL